MEALGCKAVQRRLLLHLRAAAGLQAEQRSQLRDLKRCWALRQKAGALFAWKEATIACR